MGRGRGGFSPSSASQIGARRLSGCSCRSSPSALPMAVRCCCWPHYTEHHVRSPLSSWPPLCERRPTRAESAFSLESCWRRAQLQLGEPPVHCWHRQEDVSAATSASATTSAPASALHLHTHSHLHRACKHEAGRGAHMWGCAGRRQRRATCGRSRRRQARARPS